MSLRTSHSATNLVVDSGLVVTYSVSRVSGYWAQSSSMGFAAAAYYYMYEIRRHARQSFRYVGMTRAAAQSCKDAMVAKYTRSTKASEWDSWNGSWAYPSGGSVPMAEVAMSHNEDGSYDVVVNVNEDDSRMAHSNSTYTMAVLFYNEQRRAYEGGESETPQIGGGS